MGGRLHGHDPRGRLHCPVAPNTDLAAEHEPPLSATSPSRTMLTTDAGVFTDMLAFHSEADISAPDLLRLWPMRPSRTVSTPLNQAFRLVAGGRTIVHKCTHLASGSTTRYLLTPVFTSFDARLS
ncbi:hypothetical protein MLPF_3070 [Mycobacterium lepromatosis]|nr:hypothetical protein MLPF_3070 [Mycobacterium lepromatosis]